MRTTLEVVNSQMIYSRFRARKLALRLAATSLVCLPALSFGQTPNKPAEQKKAAQDPAPNAAQIELLDTSYKFELNGDNRKEVHARVKINSELGARQFGKLNFDYDRGFQQIEIPLVRIVHASGGTAEILPSAISDQANPVTAGFPALEDARVKSVRILGLQPGDILEYRVLTTTTKHPMAPDFWMEHAFDHTGVVSEEEFLLDLPEKSRATVKIAAASPPDAVEEIGDGDAKRKVYRWNRKAKKEAASGTQEAEKTAADVTVTTMESAEKLSARLGIALLSGNKDAPITAARAAELTAGLNGKSAKLAAIYEFVSKKIATVDLPVGATGFRIRGRDAILASGYGTQEEKTALLQTMANALQIEAHLCLTMSPEGAREVLLPSALQHALVNSSADSKQIWLDPSAEIAPFGMIASNYRGKPALLVTSETGTKELVANVPDELPFTAFQRVNTDGALSKDGTLTASVHYVLRGDSELLLRATLHQSPKEKWKDVAQLLALSDGFRGKVLSVTASDPLSTNEPLTIDYEIEQPKFVDWTKTPVRIPALLPLPGLPDPPVRSTAGTSPDIVLGTPLSVELRATLRLPKGTSAQAPTGTAVERDYAKFSSQYSAKENVVSASRSLDFLMRSIPGTRAVDYNAFLHAVQSDQAQWFTLVAPAAAPFKASTAAAK